MKIMKVVYQQENNTCDPDGSNSQNYMGEESWTVGETFNGEFIQGDVSSIFVDGYGWVDVYVVPKGTKIVIDSGAPYVGKRAFSIPPHAVQRIYYGEE